MSGECETCGAPLRAGLAACEYCRRPVPVAAGADATGGPRAIRCPACGVANAWGATHCASCQAWVVVQCGFCGGLSPHDEPACLSCGEAFAGAAERLAARQRSAALGAVGEVAAPLLGMLAGVVIGEALDD